MAAAATTTTSEMAQKTEKQLKEEEEFIEDFFTNNIHAVKEFVSLFDRIPTCLFIFFFRFQICQRIAVKMLAATNSVYALFFAARLLLCHEAIDYDFVFCIERVAFFFASLCYFCQFMICGKLAAALYFFTNFLLIKSILEQVGDWSSFWTLGHKKYLYVTHRPEFSDNEASDHSDRDGDESEPELENESSPKEEEESDGNESEPELENEQPPPKEEEVEQEDTETPKETNAKLGSEDLQKQPYEYDYKNRCEIYDLGSDEEADGEIVEEEEKAKSYKEEGGGEESSPELGEFALASQCKELIVLVNEYREHWVELQKERNDLAVKLHAATETLEQYRKHYIVIEKDYVEHQIMWEEEKRKLTTKIDELVETLKHYQHIIQEHVFKNSNYSAANAAVDDSSLQLQASLVSARASLYDYQMKYQNSINESEEKRLKWEHERTELNATLSAIGSWYQYYVLATYDYQLQNHNLLVERNDLSTKLHSANASAEFYKACLDDSDEECRTLREENSTLSAKLFAEISSAERYHNIVHELEEKNRKLEDEKNELVTKLCAAKSASALYRRYLHDVGGS